MWKIFGRASADRQRVLVLGATGKTGRRIVELLENRGVDVRGVSRSSAPRFDWHTRDNWAGLMQDVSAIYINFAPDLAVPGATDAISQLVETAKRSGVKRLVLLSGRGEEEAQACEAIVQASGLEWTIVRASWFNQNFSEGAFLDMVQSGLITLPAGDVGEPFVDVNDIAEVAAVALSEDGHSGEVYEVTGPRLLTFSEAAEIISEAAGRPVHFQFVPSDVFLGAMKAEGVPDEVVWLLGYLFGTVLDGRNAHLCDGVQRALGREPRDFADYAQEVAATGLWQAKAEAV